MARPTKHEHEKRQERFNLRFTLAEIEQLRAQAQAAGLPPHEYARRRVLGHQVSPAPARADAQMLSEINRIGMELNSWGVNLNQLARDVNADREFRGGDWEGLRERLREGLDQLQAVLSKVAARYGA